MPYGKSAPAHYITLIKRLDEAVVALGKGGALCKLNGGPLLYIPLYHDLSAHAIKHSNAFHKLQDQKTNAIAALIKSNVC